MRYQTGMVTLVIGCTIILSASFFASTYLSAQPTLKAEQLPVEARLTPRHQQLLKALGLKIVTPTYIPRGFALEKVLAEIGRPSIIDGTSYTIFYRRYDSNSNKDFCFAIEATNGGIGDIPDGTRSFPINSPTLGKSSLEYGEYGQGKSPTYLSNWLGKGPFYHFVGAGVLPGLSNCSNISSQEAIRVTESLQ